MIDPRDHVYPPGHYFAEKRPSDLQGPRISTWWGLVIFIAGCLLAGWVGSEVQHSIDAGSLVGPVQEPRR